MTTRILIACLIAGPAAWLISATGCGASETPEPEPEPEVARKATPLVPKVQYALPTRNASTPVPIGSLDKEIGKALSKSRKPLYDVVESRGRDPENPWAIAHAMLVLGPEMTVPGSDKPAYQYLAERWGQPVQLGTERLWTFPPRQGQQIVDVHTDLLLKAFTEGGLKPDHEVEVGGQPATLGDLYRRSLFRTWVAGDRTGFRGRGLNDAPWALQALTSWAPTHLRYTAENGSTMRLQDVTRALREAIARDTADMKAARDAGRTMKKDTRRGFFSYTCGGQHALQGLSYAVARGFGNDADKHEVCEQLKLLGWRTDVELGTVDPLIATGTPEIKLLLNVQRLKYLGHTLETVHKAAAMGVCELDDAMKQAQVRAASELAATVSALDKMQAFDSLDAIERNPAFAQMRQGGGHQVVLDLIGDSAHAIRGIDMATGEGTILY